MLIRKYEVAFWENFSFLPGKRKKFFRLKSAKWFAQRVAASVATYHGTYIVGVVIDAKDHSKTVWTTEQDL